MVRLVNRAKMTTATTGTGTVTLGTASGGFQTFAGAGVVDGDLVRYVLEEGDNFEIGTGVFDATGGTLTRNPSESSAGGGALTLAGNALVFLTATAADIQSDVEINGGTIDGTAIGGTTAAAGSFTSVNGGPLAGFRNATMNGNFDHWQRGTSGTGGYLSDRWTTLTVGSTAAISRQAFTLGQTDVPNEPEYFHRVVVTSVAGAGNFVAMQHRVEDVRTFAGQTATLSFYAKADATKNIAAEFSQNFGTGGSPSAIVDSLGVTTLALTTTFQKFTVTVTLPSITGKTIGTNDNDFLVITLFFDAGSNFNARNNSLGQQSGTFDIAQVQLEAGSVATPFERRPVGTELALCQRYFEVFGGAFVTSGDQFHGYYFKVIKRAAPTLAIITVDAGTGATLASAQPTAHAYQETAHSGASSFTASADAEL